MHTFMKNFFILSILFICLSSVSYSQTHGQIFTKQEAAQMFGEVLNSISVPVSSFQNFLTQTTGNIMFRIAADKVVVLNNKRAVIHPHGTSVSSADVFTMYSVSIINNLLNKSIEPEVFIEQRESVLTITYGGFTLEFGTLCPPICD